MTTSEVAFTTSEMWGNIAQTNKNVSFPVDVVLSIQIGDNPAHKIVDPRIPEDLSKSEIQKRNVELDTNLARRLGMFCTQYFGGDSDPTQGEIRFDCHSALSYWMGGTEAVKLNVGISAFGNRTRIEDRNRNWEGGERGQGFALYELDGKRPELRHTYLGLGLNIHKRQNETLSVNGPNGPLLITPPHTMLNMYASNPALYRLQCKQPKH
ncbi:MAG TPA: hypothetical protein VJR27_01645 [Candidatus Saccharimonadales bacterium]|nr:hypothetical protein [Candidatus Saccharimonadales bacterium]